MTKLLSECKSFVALVLFLCVLIGNTNSCCDCGWDFLTEQLFPTLGPLLSSTTAYIEDLFSLDSKKGIHTLDSEEKGPIPTDLITDCFKSGRDLSKSAASRGNELVKGGASLAPCSRALANFFYSPLPGDAKKATRASHEMLAATKLLQMKMCSSYDVTPNTFMSFLDHQVIKADSRCCKPYSIRCGKDKYRSYDGTCNNLDKPGWGRKGAPFTRIAAPRYADGGTDTSSVGEVSLRLPYVFWGGQKFARVKARYRHGIFSMPMAKSGRPLPNARVLSTRLFPDYQIPSRSLNYMNMQWGQFITHDLMLHVMEITDEGGIQCCLGDGAEVLTPEWQNDKCIPISVPEDDPFYRYYGVRCINLVRSVTAPRDDCTLGYAEQMNIATSYLDGSQIYGSDEKQASGLRSKKGGRLREEYKTRNKRGYLPSVSDKSSCDLRNTSEPCYIAGDARINQTPTLAMMHTILLREHNRVADILSRLNSLWSDERLFQEARRVVIAQLQHITYQEWLPLNFGESYFRYYRVSPSTLHSHDYSEAVSAGVLNSFGASALRAMHSLVPATLMTRAKDEHGYVHRLSDHYQNPSLLETSSESFDDVARGSLAHSGSDTGPYCTAEITNLLFKSRNPWGLDLIAIDIQRGRDHGIASYNEFREICGLRRASTFQDLAGEIAQDRVHALSVMYECVDDIDLFVGGAMEQPVQGSILGHTFQCIVAEQFYRTRVGDRFFYDNSEMPHSFTQEQLYQLKKSSMARLICENTDVEYVQRNAFQVESVTNPRSHCDDYGSIPYLDLTPWKSSIFD